MVLRMRVRIEGIREVLAAFSKLPKDAQDTVRDRSFELAASLVGPVQAAAAGRGRQAARAATSVKAVRDRVPVLQAGTGAGKLAKALLFGSEFGATAHFGWYRKGRYARSAGKQFPPHLGAQSYWFFRTVEHEGPRISKAYLDMAQEMCDRWGR